jgi:hypothetical protein
MVETFGERQSAAIGANLAHHAPIRCCERHHQLRRPNGRRRLLRPVDGVFVPAVDVEAYLCEGLKLKFELPPVPNVEIKQKAMSGANKAIDDLGDDLALDFGVRPPLLYFCDPPQVGRVAGNASIPKKKIPIDV